MSRSVLELSGLGEAHGYSGLIAEVGHSCYFAKPEIQSSFVSFYPPGLPHFSETPVLLILEEYTKPTALGS
jgi:hypothetical protein